MSLFMPRYQYLDKLLKCRYISSDGSTLVIFAVLLFTRVEIRNATLLVSTAELSVDCYYVEGKACTAPQL